MKDPQTRKTRKAKIDRLLAQYARPVQQAISGSRKDKGLNQTEAAELMGWSMGTLANIEEGRRQISVLEFIVLAKQMDIDPVAMLKRAIDWYGKS